MYYKNDPHASQETSSCKPHLKGKEVGVQPECGIARNAFLSVRSIKYDCIIERQLAENMLLSEIFPLGSSKSNTVLGINKPN